MTQYTVDPTAVAAAAGATRASGLVLSTEVGAMMGHLTALETSWQGAASAQFSVLASQWRATQAQVEANLDAISIALDNAARQYTDTEDSTVRMFAV